eukprot:TRINITY_DN12923_c0_g1_i1.p1 TRINITY_DN12923_c0_g1~~TRINITY_DN12923_c0_g1_i1.p1  ORF type:complete len:818 (-),score=129.88 TRINITY_DN12923_c0_g1_i1:121-2574(-)
MGGKQSKRVRLRDASDNAVAAATDHRACKEDGVVLEEPPHPSAPRLVLFLSDTSKVDSFKQRRCKFLQTALWDALEAKGFYLERVALSEELQVAEKRSGGREAWVLGFTPGAARKAAELQGLPVKRIFRLQTPEGSVRSFIRWKPFRLNADSKDDGEALDTHDDFESADVLSLLYTSAFRAVLPRMRVVDEEDKDFEDLELLCAAHHSVLSLALHGGALLKVTAMHDPVTRRKLSEQWPPMLRFARLPVDSIVKYFGLHTGEYFLFLDEYACWLSAPAVAGVMVHLVHMFYWVVDGINYPISRLFVTKCFMVFVSVWSTVFIEHWKRTRSGLFNDYGYREASLESQADCEAPALFHVDYNRLRQAFSRKPKSEKGAGTTVQRHPRREAALYPLLRFLHTVFGMCCLAGVVGLVISLLLYIGEIAGSCSSLVLQNAPVVLYLVVVSFMEMLYKGGVEYLVRCERHASYAEHLKSLTSKTLFFQLLNYLGWFLYVAFWMRDLPELREQLLIFMTVKQVISIAQEVIVPVLQRRLTRKQLQASHRKEEKWTKTAESLQQRSPSRQSVQSVQSPSSFWRRWRPIKNSLQTGMAQGEGADGGSSPETLRRRKAGVIPTTSSSVPRVSELGTSAKLGDGTCLASDIDRQLNLEKADLNIEYQQLIVLFALSTSFAVALPLGPFLALLHTVASRWSDGWKFLNVNMRAAPSPASGVISQTWVDVLEGLSVASVVCNFAVLAVSENDPEHKVNLFHLVALEHVLLVFKAYLAWSVPDQPEWMRREDADFHALKRYNTLLADQKNLGSTFVPALGHDATPHQHTSA